MTPGNAFVDSKQMQEQTKKLKWDLQKRPTKEAYKGGLEKRHKPGNTFINRKQVQEQTKEWKWDLYLWEKRPTKDTSTKDRYMRHKDQLKGPTKET